MNNTLDFLTQLEQHNDRDWFKTHKSTYQSCLEDFKIRFNELESYMQVHDSLASAKVFRIYRDVRFSKNKRPYKICFSGSFVRKKPELRGGYYLHIQPNNQSFIGTGFWNPNKEDLKRIRQEIEMDDSEIRDILNEKALKSVWGELQGDALKTAPRHFDKAHKAIDLIRKKQFIFTKTFTDKQVLDPQFMTTVNNDFKAIRPFFDYMSAVLTTNMNGESLI
jgi:uncharacterized protein (TIGR02453 family)